MPDEHTKDLVMSRTFDAPIEKVWKAWADPSQLKTWWGPKHFTAPTIVSDFRVGGQYLYCMRGAPQPGAPVQDFWSTGTFKEIVPMEKLVVTDSFADETGKVVSASHYGMEGFPLELQVTVLFAEVGNGATKMTLRHAGLPDGPMKDATATGWNQSFDKMEEHLKDET